MTEEEKKTVENFKKFIKSKEDENDFLYGSEEFYRDDIKQNELFLKMLHSIENLIQKQQAELEKKEQEIKCLKCLHNKQIDILDAMAEYIDLNCDCIKGFDKCEQINDPHCLECIKQYFEKQVEKE